MTDRCEPPTELRGVDGWHWVQPHDWEPIPARWHAAENAGNEPRWTSSHHVPSGTPAWAYEHWGWRYLSPVATPAEVEALRAERDRLETTALNAAGQVDNLRAVAAAAQAELATLRARVAELEGALGALHAAVKAIPALTASDFSAELTTRFLRADTAARAALSPATASVPE